jgi:hypothetical protein
MRSAMLLREHKILGALQNAASYCRVWSVGALAASINFFYEKAEGIPLLSPKPSSERFKLKLAGSRMYKTGIVSLENAVEYEPA